MKRHIYIEETESGNFTIVTPNGVSLRPTIKEAVAMAHAWFAEHPEADSVEIHEKRAKRLVKRDV